MATIVNNPSGTTDSGNGMGFVLGVILLIIFVIALLYYGLPALRGGSTGGSSIQLPSQINVHTNQ